MTLINEVKKALCRTGIEMDARDIVDHLSRLPRHAIHVTPAQVSHALHALATSGGDVIRTRPGLYQHQPADPELEHSVPVARPALAIPAVAPDPLDSGQPVEQSCLIIADSVFVGSLLPLSVEPEDVRLRKAAAFLLGVAHVQLDRAIRLVWCAGALATAVEVTRHQYGRQAVVAITTPEVVAEARQTADMLNLTLRAWGFSSLHEGADPDALRSSRGTDDLVLDVSELRAACDGPRRTPRPSRQDTTAAVRSDRSAVAADPRTDQVLDSLWQLDVRLYQQRVDGVTGHGNSHTLKRQALLVGRTYAERWSSVVTDADRDQLAAQADRDWVPGRLFADLLAFADAHHLPVHGSPVIKDLLRRGFWQHVRSQEPDAGHSSAA